MVSRRALGRTLTLLAAGSLGACGVANAVVGVGGGSAIVATHTALGSTHDGIVVLAGGVRGDAPSPLLEDRLITALELHRARAAPRLLVTGDERARETGVMKRWLLARDVPEEAILVDGEGVDTYSSMHRARSVFALSDVIVVTQRFHLPRALYLARALGLSAVGVEAEQVRYGGSTRHRARELLARPAAMIDVFRRRTPNVQSLRNAPRI